MRRAASSARVAFAHHAQEIVRRAELLADAGGGEGHRLGAVAGLERRELVADHLADRGPFLVQAAWRRRGGAANGDARTASQRERARARSRHLHRAAHSAHRARRVARHARARACAWRARRRCRNRPAQRLADAGEELERFGRLHRAHDADQRREHAHRRAARLLELLALAEQAVVAGRARVARIEHRDLPVEAHRGAGHQRLARAHARARSPRGASRSCRSSRARRRRRARAARARSAPTRCAIALDAHFGIDRGEALRRGVDLARADVVRRVQDLPLQVGEVDVVGVADRERAHAGRREELRGGRAEAAHADHERVRRGELLLRVRCRARPAGCAGCSAGAGCRRARWCRSVIGAIIRAAFSQRKRPAGAGRFAGETTSKESTA